MKRLGCLFASFMVITIARAPVLADWADTAAPLSVYAHVGPLQLTIPFQSGRLVALWDFVAKRPLAGMETTLAQVKVDKSSADPWDLDLTGGFVTDESAKGAPIFGINLAKTNPSPQLASIEHLKLGVFVGYNTNAGNGSSKPVMAGAKMAYQMRFW